jgi:hypothetical protein
MALSKVIQKDIDDCLLIYSELWNCFESCEKIAPPTENAIAIFFPDLIRILTGIQLKINDLRCEHEIPKDLIDFQVNSCPYVSYGEIKRGKISQNKSFDFQPKPARELPLRRGLVRLLSGLVGGLGGARVGSRGLAQVSARDILKGGYSYHYLKPAPVSIPDIEPQLARLKEGVEHLTEALRWPFAPNDILGLAQSHISARSERGGSQKPSVDIVLTGTLLNTENRMIAVNALQHGIPVIAFAQGPMSDQLFNEPYGRYGEQSLCIVYFGMGQSNRFPEIENERYPILGNEPIFVSSIENSPSARENIRIRALDLDSTRLMYVPDSCTYTERYGPYITSNEQQYWAWQRELLRQFGYKKVIYKRHIKGHPLYRQLDEESLISHLSPQCFCRLEVETRKFEDVYLNCDAFIFDQCTTAFAIAASTDKPIIYLDLGKRNFSELGLKLMKERCIYLQIDPDNPGDLIAKIRDQGSDRKVNSFLREDWLAENPKRTIDFTKLKHIISKLSRPTP